MTNTPYNRKIQNFFEEYIDCSPDAVVNGMMKKKQSKKQLTC